MRTTVVIDDGLMERVTRAGGFRTKHEAIVTALTEFLRRRDQEALRAMRGQVEFEEGHLERLDALEQAAPEEQE
jgi:Arc/MetJ family transcription regulator